MKTLIAGLALASASALGLAPKADASPTTVYTPSVYAHGRSYGTVGIGFNLGGGYAPGGYYRTYYRSVPQTVLVGYDVYGYPIYGTRWIQQPVTVFVPVRSYAQPTVNVGFGWRW